LTCDRSILLEGSVLEDRIKTPWLVLVRREIPAQFEAYQVPLQQRLPRVAIPLDWRVPDVVLDIQAAFTRCWSVGPYPGLSKSWCCSVFSVALVLFRDSYRGEKQGE